MVVIYLKVKGIYTGFFGGGGGGGKKFVGHCYSIMHEFAAHMLTSFLGGWGIEAGGRGISGHFPL